MVRIPKEHISTRSSPTSELLTNSRSFSVRYSNCEMSVLCWTRPEQRKEENRRKERESLISVCEISASIWEVMGLEHLHTQHAEKQSPTPISAAKLLLLSLALAQRTPLATHSPRIPPLLSSSFSCLSFLQPRCTTTSAQGESLRKEAWTEVTSS